MIAFTGNAIYSARWENVINFRTDHYSKGLLNLENEKKHSRACKNYFKASNFYINIQIKNYSVINWSVKISDLKCFSKKKI